MAKAKKIGRLTQAEKKFIEQNCRELSDEEIGSKIGRYYNTVKKYRESIGVMKGPHGIITKDEIDPPDIGPADPYRPMDEVEKIKWFQLQLKNSKSYPLLKNQFTPEEIEFYIEEFSLLCLQFEDVATTEIRQIEELVKTQILDQRMLRSIKHTEDEIELLAAEIDDFRKKKDMSDETNQELDDMRVALVKQMAAQSNMMNSDHLRNVDLRQKLLEGLNARRRDRISEIDQSKTTFLGLVKSLQDEEIKLHQGRHAELVRLATKKKLDTWRQPQVFPDGTKDPIIIDSETPLSAVVSEKLAKILMGEREKLEEKAQTSPEATDA